MVRKVLKEAAKTSCEVSEVLAVRFIATFSIGGIPLLKLRDDYTVWVGGWSDLLPCSIKVCRSDWSQLLLGLQHSTRLLTGRQEVNTQCRPLVGWRFGHVSQAQNTPQLYNLSLAISQGRIHNIARDPGRCRMYLRMLACNYSRCTHLLISSCCHIFVLGKQPIYRSAAACVWLSLLLLLHMLHMLHHVPS